MALQSRSSCSNRRSHGASMAGEAEASLDAHRRGERGGDDTCIRKQGVATYGDSG